MFSRNVGTGRSFTLLARIASCAALPLWPQVSFWPHPSPPNTPEQLKALRWRSVGPGQQRRPRLRGRRRPRQPRRLLRRRRERRHHQDHERRHHVQADLRQGARRVDRRDRRCAERSEHHLRRHGGGEPAQQRVDRRRHVQVRRRRRALDAHRARAERQDRAHRRRREESGRRLRVRPRARVGAERGARRLQDRRRRQDVEKGALRRLPDRLLRHRGRSGQLEHSLRRDVHVPPVGVAPRVGRRQHGGVSLEQRRRDLGAALRQRSRARSAEDGHGSHRHRRGAERSVDRVRDQRDEERGRAVALGRRRRPLAHGEPRSEHQLPSVLLRRHSRRPAESQPGVLALRFVVHVGRRRPELPHDRARRARRPSGDVDRPDEPQVHPERVGRRLAGELRRRQELRGREQLSVHAVLPHQLRHAAAVHGVRRTAGQRQLVRPEPGAVGAGRFARTTGSPCPAATGSSPCR